jgi:hypothetical protein
MERDLRRGLEQAISEVKVYAAWRRETTRGGNLQDHLMKAISDGVISLFENHSAAPKLNEQALVQRAQSRIGITMHGLGQIRNADILREYAVGLVTRCVADCAFEMLAAEQ